MTDDNNNFVSREEYEQFQKRVVDVLGVVFQYLDKNIITSRVTQASINNLSEAIEDLAKMQADNFNINSQNNQMLSELYKKLLGPGE